ncbi:MAG: glycosyltransferase, partial [Cellulophaga sp.]
IEMKKKIHVCILMPSHWSNRKGGAQLQARYIMDFLQEKDDIKITYVCRNVKFNSKNNIYKLPKKILSKYFYFIDKKNIFDILDKIKPDYIYQRVLCSYTGIAAKYCKKNATKMIFHVANSPDVEPQKAKFNKFFLANLIEKYYREYGINNADLIVGQAEYQDQLLWKHYSRRCDLIMPNISPDVYATKKSSALSKKIILWVANIKEQKGPDIFLKLAKEFVNNDQIEFHMAGKVTSKYGKEIKENAFNMKNVFYHGELSLEEVNVLMSEAYLFINTSKYEGFPNTFIQAWMNMTPVLSLNVDPDNIIEKNGLGWFCGDYSTLLTNLERMIEIESNISIIGEKCRSFALEYFSLNNVESLYRLIRNSFTTGNKI